MAFRDELRPASFKGVPFETVDLSLDFGRMGVVQSPVGEGEESFFDDLRLKPRRFSIAAFILASGEDAVDYARRRDALIKAIESKGTGTLVHPTFGTLQGMQCTSSTLNETLAQGGSANFQLEFVKTGARAFPNEEADRPGLARNAGADVLDEIELFFEEAWDAVGQLDYVVDRGINEAQDRIDRLTEIVQDAGDELEDAAATLNKLDTLGASLVSLADEPADLVEDIVEILEGIGVRQTLAAFAREIVPVEVASSNPNDIQAETNSRAMSLLWRIGATAVAVQAAASEEFDTADAATRARDELEDLIVADEERDDISRELHDKLIDMRVATWQDLTERAAQLPSIVTYTPPGVTSALELAQLLYQDATRADEIVKRNNLPHSGFIPPVELEVLSR